MASIHEECGVFGMYTSPGSDVGLTTYYALFALQHRGQESAGIAVNDDGVISKCKDVGLVSDVFTPQALERLGKGSIAVGHVRYGTTGNGGRTNAQPIVVNHVKGAMALAHNGNLTNAVKLRRELEMGGAIFHTTSDTEVIAYIITRERLKCGSIEEAVSNAMDILEGAYSLVVMSPKKLICCRDPHGFRPLCFGQRESDGAWMVASESCALDAVGAKMIADVQPGEILVFDGHTMHSIDRHVGTKKPSMCVFEYIYFARPDSVIDGASVHEARVRAGAFLALRHPVQADVVVGVPDSGLDAAEGYARQSGIPYAMGFVKSRYVARTFIAPGQENREDKVRMKLNCIRDVVKGKRVVMIDDSIVRGTTSRPIINQLWQAGAREVHMRVSAPPFLNPCYYGVDIDSRDHLIACHHTVEEIAEILHVNSLGYLDVGDVHMLAANGGCGGFCTACFNGDYPTDIPGEREKFMFEQKISEKLQKSGT